MTVREIENRLRECHNVRDVCVLPGPVSLGPTRYRAFVVLGRNTPAVREHLQAHCNVRLKSAYLTIKLELMDSLPRKLAGTVSRRRLVTGAKHGK